MAEQQREEGRGEPKQKRKAEGPGFSRRTFAFGVAGTVALLGLGGVRYVASDPLCRPPGAQDEDHLVRACLHCEKCRESCPKGAIATAHVEQGILNARTPRMDFKRGWCDFCENELDGPRCASVCPTGAIARQGHASYVLGKARLTRDWCLAARGMGCHECVDACNYQALALGYDHVPVVNYDACNGCGACEFACVSMSSGSLTVGATDRAITIRPLAELEA